MIANALAECVLPYVDLTNVHEFPPTGRRASPVRLWPCPALYRVTVVCWTGSVSCVRGCVQTRSSGPSSPTSLFSLGNFPKLGSASVLLFTEYHLYHLYTFLARRLSRAFTSLISDHETVWSVAQWSHLSRVHCGCLCLACVCVAAI